MTKKKKESIQFKKAEVFTNTHCANPPCGHLLNAHKEDGICGVKHCECKEYHSKG